MTNIEFPGRANYTGPDSGILGLCHHDELFEPSHSFAERVGIIKRDKPENERAIRLHNLIYIDLNVVPGIPAKAHAELYKARAEWRPQILAYIRSKIPDCAWDEQKHELSFAPKG